MKTKYLFVDTNFFLQCRAMAELDWGQVVTECRLTLIVPRAVQEEIDRLKSDGNARRSKRARNANSVLRTIILSEDEQLIVANAPVYVTLALSPPLPIQIRTSGLVHLDPHRPDDAVMLELLNYREIFPDKDAGLLTHDTVPLMTAKRLGVPFVLIPDGWLLKPEPSTEDKKIRELQAQLAAYENTLPKIRFLTPDLPSATITKTVVSYPSLSKTEIESLMDCIREKYPPGKPQMAEPKNEYSGLRTPMYIHQLREFVPPTDEEIRKYEDEEYPAWLKKVREKLIALSERIAMEAASFTLPFQIENCGNSPAEALLVRIDVSEGLFILPPDDRDDDEESENWSSFPPPPEVPEGTYRSALMPWGRAISAINDYSFLNSPLLMDGIGAHHSNPDEFLWRNNRPKKAQARWEFTCERFRHKSDPEVFDLVIASSNIRPAGGSMSCRVAANNLIENAELIIPIKLSYETGDTISEIRRMWVI